MRTLTRTTLGWLPLILLAPWKATAAECTTNVTEVCEAAKDLNLDRLLGDYADFGLIFLGLVGLAFVGSLIVSLRRLFRHRKGVKIRVGDELREIEPGGSARLTLEVENPNSLVPLSLLLEPGGLPEGWKHRLRSIQELRSGFRVVHEAEGNLEMRLESKAVGPERATVVAELSAPDSVADGEIVEYDLQFIPYQRGILRPRKARVASSKLLVIVRPPKVQITKVTHAPTKIITGRPVLTKVHVVNEGERPASNVAVRFLLNGEETDKKVLPELDVKGEADLEFTWTAKPGENHIRVAVV